MFHFGFRRHCFCRHRRPKGDPHDFCIRCAEQAGRSLSTASHKSAFSARISTKTVGPRSESRIKRENTNVKQQKLASADPAAPFTQLLTRWNQWRTRKPSLNRKPQRLVGRPRPRFPSHLSKRTLPRTRFYSGETRTAYVGTIGERARG